MSKSATGKKAKPNTIKVYQDGQFSTINQTTPLHSTIPELFNDMDEEDGGTGVNLPPIFDDTPEGGGGTAFNIPDITEDSAEGGGGSGSGVVIPPIFIDELEEIEDDPTISVEFKQPFIPHIIVQEEGESGEKGDPGVGEKGDPGERGANGLSHYEIWSAGQIAGGTLASYHDAFKSNIPGPVSLTTFQLWINQMLLTPGNNHFVSDATYASHYSTPSGETRLDKYISTFPRGPEGAPSTVAGPTGLSAYQFYKTLPGNTYKTEYQYWADIKGDTGNTGETGPDGERGFPGQNGFDGLDGDPAHLVWRDGSTGSDYRLLINDNSYWQPAQALVNYQHFLSMSSYLTWRSTKSGLTATNYTKLDFFNELIYLSYKSENSGQSSHTKTQMIDSLLYRGWTSESFSGYAKNTNDFKKFLEDTGYLTYKQSNSNATKADYLKSLEGNSAVEVWRAVTSGSTPPAGGVLSSDPAWFSTTAERDSYKAYFTPAADNVVEEITESIGSLVAIAGGLISGMAAMNAVASAKAAAASAASAAESEANAREAQETTEDFFNLAMTKDEILGYSSTGAMTTTNAQYGSPERLSLRNRLGSLFYFIDSIGGGSDNIMIPSASSGSRNSSDTNINDLWEGLTFNTGRGLSNNVRTIKQTDNNMSLVWSGSGQGFSIKYGGVTASGKPSVEALSLNQHGEMTLRFSDPNSHATSNLDYTSVRHLNYINQIAEVDGSAFKLNSGKIISFKKTGSFERGFDWDDANFMRYLGDMLDADVNSNNDGIGLNFKDSKTIKFLKNGGTVQTLNYDKLSYLNAIPLHINTLIETDSSFMSMKNGKSIKFKKSGDDDLVLDYMEVEGLIDREADFLNLMDTSSMSITMHDSKSIKFKKTGDIDMVLDYDLLDALSCISIPSAGNRPVEKHITNAHSAYEPLCIDRPLVFYTDYKELTQPIHPHYSVSATELFNYPTMLNRYAWNWGGAQISEIWKFVADVTNRFSGLDTRYASPAEPAMYLRKIAQHSAASGTKIDDNPAFTADSVYNNLFEGEWIQPISYNADGTVGYINEKFVDGVKTSCPSTTEADILNQLELNYSYFKDIESKLLPTSGSVGYILSKTSSGSQWINQPTSLPSGGYENQILARTFNGYGWINQPSAELPSGGDSTIGYILSKTQYGSEWIEQFPTGGVATDILQKTATGYAWVVDPQINLAELTTRFNSWEAGGLVTDGRQDNEIISLQNAVTALHPTTSFGFLYNYYGSGSIKTIGEVFNLLEPTLDTKLTGYVTTSSLNSNTSGLNVLISNNTASIAANTASIASNTLPSGTNGQFLSLVSGSPQWVAAPSGGTGTGTGTGGTTLPAGSEGQILVYSSSGPVWMDFPEGGGDSGGGTGFDLGGGGGTTSTPSGILGTLNGNTVIKSRGNQHYEGIEFVNNSYASTTNWGWPSDTDQQLMKLFVDGRVMIGTGTGFTTTDNAWDDAQLTLGGRHNDDFNTSDSKYKFVIIGSNNDVNNGPDFTANGVGNVPMAVIDENGNCLFQLTQQTPYPGTPYIAMLSPEARSTTHLHNSGDLTLGAWPAYTTGTPIVPLDSRKHYAGQWNPDDKVLAILGRNMGGGGETGRIAIGGGNHHYACITGSHTGGGLTQLDFETCESSTTAPAHRMRIDAWGKIGMGTSSPIAPLNVNYRMDSTSSWNEEIRAPGTLTSTYPSESLWLAKGSPDLNNYWGMSLGTKWTGASYIQCVNLSNNAVYYNLLLNPNGGNVGIGTHNPRHLLEISGGNISFGDYTQRGAGGISFVGVFDTTSNPLAGMEIENTGSTYYQKLHFRTHGPNDNGRRMMIDENGNVGIGTTTPGQKLSVSGNIHCSGVWGWGTANWHFGMTHPSAHHGAASGPTMRLLGSMGHHLDYMVAYHTFYINYYCDHHDSCYRTMIGIHRLEVYHTNWNNRLAGDVIVGNDLLVNGFIQAGEHVSAPNGFYWGGTFLYSSDKRIKNDIEDVPDDEALNIINKIETKRYNYISPERRKEEPVIGFIAQQIKEVLPNAVTLQEGVIPDELKYVKVSWEKIAGGDDMASDISGNGLHPDSDNKWKFTLEDDIIMDDNHTGRCRFYFTDEGDTKETKRTLDLVDDKSFIVTKKWDNIYFYGKEINDFHTIDKSQINALTVGACQELSRENRRLKARLDDIEERLNSAGI